MSYKISVITPLYNAIDTMDATLESVKRQSIGFENIEYLVADDCSGDGSYERALEWEKQYSNVRVLRTERNSGSDGTPRNLAMPQASAPYFMFIDADDLLMPDACEKLYDEIIRSGCDIVTGDCFAANADGTRSPEADADIMRCPDAAEGEYDFASFGEKECRLFCYNFCAKIYRSDIVREYSLRFSGERMWADAAFLYSYLTVCKSGSLVHTDVFSRTVASGTLSHDHNVSYYEAIPRSIGFGLAQTKRIGTDSKYLRFVDLAGNVEHYMGMLLGEKDFSDEQAGAALGTWSGVLALAHENCFYLHSAHAKICCRAAADGDTDGAIYNFLQLRLLHFQREQEKANIFGSTSWKLASKILTLLKRG